jgi:hypothetical protein
MGGQVEVCCQGAYEARQRWAVLLGAEPDGLELCETSKVPEL